MATTGISHVFPGAVLHPTQYFGYPTVGAPRRIKATILGVIHTTETASVPFPGPGKSWTFSVERDGTVHQFMDPVIAAAWTNGDAQSWDGSNPLVVKACTSSYNPNEFCFVTIENVNRIEQGERLTDKQLAANRAILQWASKLSGIPMDRRHVIGHYQINGVTRQRCPTVPTDRDRVFGGILHGSDTPEETMDLSKIKGIQPIIMTLKHDANVRTEASLSKDTIAYNTGDKDQTIYAIAHTWGPEFPEGSNDHWWLVFFNGNGGMFFVHQSQIATRVRMVDPSAVQETTCEEEVNAAVEPLHDKIDEQADRIAGLMTDLASAQAAAQAAEAKAQEAETVAADATALRTALQKFMG